MDEGMCKFCMDEISCFHVLYFFHEEKGKDSSQSPSSLQMYAYHKFLYPLFMCVNFFHISEVPWCLGALILLVRISILWRIWIIICGTRTLEKRIYDAIVHQFVWLSFFKNIYIYIKKIIYNF